MNGEGTCGSSFLQTISSSFFFSFYSLHCKKKKTKGRECSKRYFSLFPNLLIITRQDRFVALYGIKVAQQRFFAYGNKDASMVRLHINSLVTATFCFPFFSVSKFLLFFHIRITSNIFLILCPNSLFFHVIYFKILFI